MSVMIDALLLGWDRNLDYAKRLLADVPEDRMAHQPAVHMNHPAWIFSHVNLYHPVMKDGNGQVCDETVPVGVCTTRPMEPAM